MLDMFILFVGVMALAWFLWLPLWLAITLLTPKKLLNKYFNSTHFNAGELIVFGSFPGFFMRTSLFCRLYLTPKAAKGRNLDGFVEDSPRWYRTSVVLIVLGLISHGVFVFGAMGVILIFDL